jgi:hypothetical protein
MKRSRLKRTLLFLLIPAITLSCGCSLWPSKPVYMPVGSRVEVARTARLNCWVVNSQTGKRERRDVEFTAGYSVARIRTE